MRLLGNFFKAALTGLAIGYFLALLLGYSVWLEMRINLGTVIPVSTAFFVCAACLRGRVFRFRVFPLLEALVVATLLSIYGLEISTVLIVPASLFREGFRLSSFSLGKINLFLAALVGFSNLVWAYDHVVARRRSNETAR